MIIDHCLRFRLSVFVFSFTEFRMRSGYRAPPFSNTILYFVFAMLLREVASTQRSASSDCDCDILTAAALVPLSYFCIAIIALFLVFLYNFLEMHFVRDLITGFRGDPVVLSFHPDSRLYELVVSKCSVLHGRYLATPWLSSPHLQTAFLCYFGRHPQFDYHREVLRTPDGGTVALDWLRSCDGLRDTSLSSDKSDEKQPILKQPIVIVIPGITSDSSSSYVKHFAFKMATSGWDVCVVNHRGYFVPVTSDCFYNGGWTKDIREVARHLRCLYPQVSLYAVGVSVGANILVKYLGENGLNVPLSGAVAICSPWDLSLSDRFLHRRFLQKLYSLAITKSLQRYARLHQSIFSRLASWESITKAQTLREFDSCATSLIANYKTTDTYYRSSSSINVVQNVTIPLLSLSALDDPVCTMEAIPWDECRENKNIILATTKHGGHVAYYEGLSACRMWWVRGTSEFLGLLHSSQKELQQN